jgi:hemoglobin-like flavoprotein
MDAMTPASLHRIQLSYKQLVPHMTLVTKRFYERLFAAHPDTQALFRGDMARQQQHLAAALALVVRNLPMLDALEQPLRELGAAHARVGVRAEHYPAVCEAMTATLAEVASDLWSAELAADWRELLELISRHMLAGAAGKVSRGEGVSPSLLR